MGKTTIEWTRGDDGSPGATWNPIRGCSRVSEGCRSCYAERQAARFVKGPFKGFVAKVNGHPAWTGKVELIEKHLDDPIKWKAPRRIFVNSMSDLFHENLPHKDRARVFDAMREAPQHTYQILTKRSTIMKEFCEWWCMQHCESRLPSNWWMGVSVEDQKTADERIPLLLQTPAATRFVSYEPALGPVDFTKFLWVGEEGGWEYSYTTRNMLHQIIIGGESGPGARPFDLQWARNVIEQCRRSKTAAFFKQAGARPYVLQSDLPIHTRAWPYSKQFPDGDRIYTKLADKKGGTLSELPCDMCVREFPIQVGAPQ